MTFFCDIWVKHIPPLLPPLGSPQSPSHPPSSMRLSNEISFLFNFFFQISWGGPKKFGKKNKEQLPCLATIDYFLFQLADFYIKAKNKVILSGWPKLITLERIPPCKSGWAWFSWKQEAWDQKDAPTSAKKENRSKSFGAVKVLPLDGAGARRRIPLETQEQGDLLMNTLLTEFSRFCQCRHTASETHQWGTAWPCVTGIWRELQKAEMI